MAEITKVAPARIEIQAPASQTGGGRMPPIPGGLAHISGLVAGEAIGAGDACYIKSDGSGAWKATGAAANAAAACRGFSVSDVPVGGAVSLVSGVPLRYGTGLTPGTSLYLSGTNAGGLADSASTGGTVPIAFVIDAQRIFVL